MFNLTINPYPPVLTNNLMVFLILCLVWTRTEVDCVLATKLTVRTKVSTGPSPPPRPHPPPPFPILTRKIDEIESPAVGMESHYIVKM